MGLVCLPSNNWGFGKKGPGFERLTIAQMRPPNNHSVINGESAKVHIANGPSYEGGNAPHNVAGSSSMANGYSNHRNYNGHVINESYHNGGGLSPSDADLEAELISLRGQIAKLTEVR